MSFPPGVNCSKTVKDLIESMLKIEEADRGFTFEENTTLDMRMDRTQDLTAKEFSPEEFICKPDAQSIINKITELDKEYKVKRELALKRTMEAIKIKDNKTRTILDNALDGILLVGPEPPIPISIFNSFLLI